MDEHKIVPRGELMKKLLLGYVGFIILFFVVAMFIMPEKPPNHNLPETIKVYFTDEDITKEVNFEEYLAEVVAAEVPAEFEMEAIKAQAVAARTYIYNKYKKFTENPQSAPEEHKDATVCTDYKHCCARYSIETLQKVHGEQWMKEFYPKIQKAVKDTQGEIITYENQPITAVFHASSGGCRTENSEDVWTSPSPYLVSVESPGEDKRDGYNSVVTVSCDEFKQKVNSAYPEARLDDNRNQWFGDITFTAGNSVNYINIGKTAIRGTQMRALFNLKSACFEISMLNDTIIFNVHGSGHGVGLSQHGANLMAKSGKDYRDILTHYYTGVEIDR